MATNVYVAICSASYWGVTGNYAGKGSVAARDAYYEAQYTGLQACETARGRDLTDVAVDEIENIEIVGNDWTTAETSFITFNGYTTDATRYVNVYTVGDAKHNNNGGLDTNAYRIEVTCTWNYGPAITVKQSHIRIDGIQVKVDADTYTNCYGLQYSYIPTGTNSELHLKNSIFTGAASTGNLRGLLWIYESDLETLLMQNCIIYNSPGSGSDGMRIHVSSSVGTVDIDNCTIYNINDAAVYQSSSYNLSVKNCAVFGNGNDFLGTFDTINYCASDDGDGTNSVSPVASDWANEFTDYANGDFTILNTGNLYLGSEITNADDSNVPTVDIIGTARNTAVGDQTSIGAFEYVSTGATNLIVAESYHLNVPDGIALTQSHNLTANEAYHLHVPDGIVLTEIKDLAVNESYHLHVADNLTIDQNQNLTIAESGHLHVSDNITLTQIHNLAVNEAYHLHVADNISFNVELTIAESNHLHVPDNVTLTQTHNLAVNESDHLHVTDGIALTQAHDLIVAESDHLHIADNCILALTSFNLAVSEAAHIQTTDAIVLYGEDLLHIHPTYHLHTADSCLLPLVVQDTYHDHVVEGNLELNAIEATGAVSLPFLTLEATLGQYEAASITLPSLTMAANTGGIGDVDLPFLDVSTTALVGIIAESDLNLPMIDVSITLGGNANLELPAITVSGSPVTGTIGSGNVHIPMMSLAADSIVSHLGDVSVTMPMFCLDTTIKTGLTANCDVTIPPLISGVSGKLGVSATGNLTLGELEAASTGYNDLNTDADISLPAFMIDAYSKQSDRFDNYILRYVA